MAEWDRKHLPTPPIQLKENFNPWLQNEEEAWKDNNHSKQQMVKDHIKAQKYWTSHFKKKPETSKLEMHEKQQRIGGKSLNQWVQNDQKCKIAEDEKMK